MKYEKTMISERTLTVDALLFLRIIISLCVCVSLSLIQKSITALNHSIEVNEGVSKTLKMMKCEKTMISERPLTVDALPPNYHTVHVSLSLSHSKIHNYFKSLDWCE